MDLLRLSQNIRQLRQTQGMTLEQLATKCGLSKGFISQVENFRLMPSLKALNRLSLALGVELPQLFSDETQTPEYSFGNLQDGESIVRDNGIHFGIDYHALAYRQIGRQMEPFLIEYRPAQEERGFMMHDTEEFFVLLEGEVEFFVLDDQNPRRMRPGDTIYMKANLPHRVRLAGECTYAKALSVYSKRNG